MNILNLSKEDVKELLAAQDDEKGHHMLWVSTDGEVRLDLIPEQLTPLGYAERVDNLKFRFESYQCGAGYVGSEAATDEKWVDRVHKALTENWAAGTLEYVDHY